MTKLVGRFRHINRGQIIEDGREVEFRIEMKSGDAVTVQIPVGDLPLVINFLDNLRIKATEE